MFVFVFVHPSLLLSVCDDSIFSDYKEPVNGYPIRDSPNILFQFNEISQSHKLHMKNLSEIAFASAATGHIEPKPLVGCFTRLHSPPITFVTHPRITSLPLDLFRIGLLPPLVKLVGNLVKVGGTNPGEGDIWKEDEMRNMLIELKKDHGGPLYVLEVGQIVHQDVFFKQVENVSMRDYRAAFVDKLVPKQIEAIYLANTKYIDNLPEFCGAFLGFKVEEAYMYTVDRAGFSVIGLTVGSDNMWREYRFPFAGEVRVVSLDFPLHDFKPAPVCVAKKRRFCEAKRTPVGLSLADRC